jgi:hypothetical protein
METDDYTIRRLRAGDGAGVVALVRGIYGFNYSYREELYDADQIEWLNQTGQLVSVVALHNGEIVGHSALIRDTAGPIAETGQCMVSPPHRSHHLMDRTCGMLYDEAENLGLILLYGGPVTNHVYSQAAFETGNWHPCGLALAMLPQSFANMPTPLPQRLSDILYYKPLRPMPPAPALHVPPWHREIVSRIYAQFNVTPRFLEGGAPQALDHVVADYSHALLSGHIRVVWGGPQAAEVIDRARRGLTGMGAESIFLQIPMTQPGCAALVRRVEEMGFFFSGIRLQGAGGDSLQLQCVNVDLDPSVIQILTSFGRDIFDYVISERARVGGLKSMR